MQTSTHHDETKLHTSPETSKKSAGIAMKDKFKEELDVMEVQGIISKYDGHDISPEWLNSFVIVKKPNGSLHMC